MLNKILHPPFGSPLARQLATDPHWTNNSDGSFLKHAVVLNPLRIFSFPKLAARRFSADKTKTVKSLIDTNLSKKAPAVVKGPKATTPAEAPKPASVPEAPKPASVPEAPKPTNVTTPADKTDKTAAVAVPATVESSSAVSDAPAAAPVVAAVADVAKVAEVVVPVAEPLIRPIKLAALAQ